MIYLAQLVLPYVPAFPGQQGLWFGFFLAG